MTQESLGTIYPIVGASTFIAALLSYASFAQAQSDFVDVRQVSVRPDQVLWFTPVERLVATAESEELTARGLTYRVGAVWVTRAGRFTDDWQFRIDHAADEGRVRQAEVWRRPSDQEPPWKVWCHLDRMDDTFSCNVRREARAVAFYPVSAQRLEMICAWDHDYPGERLRYRIDSGPARTLAPDQACITHGAELAAIMAGRELLVEVTKWPNDYGRVIEVDLAGLRRAVSVTAAIQQRRGQLDWTGRPAVATAPGGAVKAGEATPEGLP